MYRVPALAVLLAAPLSAAGVVLDASFPPDRRPYLQMVANEVLEAVHQRFGVDPPINLPISCYRSYDIPITSFDNWQHPTKILIGLNVDGLYYAQITYQLGHELGHIMLDPRRSNGIVETICVALSLDVLDALFQKWGSRVPYANQILVQFAPHFKEYREEQERTVLYRFPENVRLAVEHRQWAIVQRYLQDHRAEQEQLDQREIRSQKGRDIQMLGAIALRSGPISWKDFIGMRNCTNPTSQVVPLHLKLPLTKPCIERLSPMLCRIGVGCVGRRGK